MRKSDFVERSLEQAIEVTDKELSKENIDLKNVSKGLLNIDTLNKLNAFLKSEENLKDCEPFEQLNQKYILLHNRYKSLFHELHENIIPKTNRREYAKGGKGFHRGFYSPSMMDLVVGGINRGRLLKNPPKSGNNIYEYLFDKEDRLICSYFYGKYDEIQQPCIAELLLYENDTVLSLEFGYTAWNDYVLERISECQYDNGILKKYEIASCHLLGVDSTEGTERKCDEINVETFEYVDNLIKSLFWCRYNPAIHLLTQEKYTFNRDAE